ncbi:MAG: glycerate kinase family protein [Marmoricola sp.]
MRVVVAPDKFAGTLSAVEAADAIATGWRRHAPHDDVVTVPMADGGPGFVEVLHAVRGGRLVGVTVRDPYGRTVPATVLHDGETAWIESAQAVGLHLTPPASRDPWRATSYGVGELVAAAVDLGVRRVVVGLGGSGTNDGGAGLLAALGATVDSGRLDGGPAGLQDIEDGAAVDLEAARRRVGSVELVVATDVENPLLGLVGATKTFGPQKGLAEEDLLGVDAALHRLAQGTDRKRADAKGAGAAGGLGFALLLLGATRVAGLDLVADAVGLAAHLRGADLALTGEGSFDYSSRAGKVPRGIAALAQEALVPCVVLAGRVDVGAREMRTLGIESAYSLVERYGEERSTTRPAAALADLAERVARTWSPR